MRDYSAEVIAGLNNDDPRADLIELQFSTGTLYLTTNNHNLEYEGQLWEAGFIVSATPKLTFEKDLKVINISVMLSGLDNIIGTILADNQRNRKVIVKNVILKPIDNSVVGTLISSYYLIDNFDQEADLTQNMFKLNMSNFLSDFDTTNGVRSTQSSHANFFPGSTSFLNSKDVNQELEWGSD